MTRIAASTAVNRYYLARMEAAKTNERLSSREGASEETGIDRKRMQRIEIGTLNPYPEEVMLMADAYHAPELMNFYCTSACPIGQKMMPKAELQELDRLAVKFLNALEGIKGTDKALLSIAADGKLTSDELPAMEKLLEAVKAVSAVGCELQIFVEKQGERRTWHAQGGRGRSHLGKSRTDRRGDDRLDGLRARHGACLDIRRAE